MVRQASSIAGAHAVTGDLKDRASLDAACRGVTTVITTANSARRGGADNVESVDLSGNRALIDAATAAGVRQFVFVSVAAADPSSPVPFFAAKAATEAHLRNSGMAWTIVAPHIFMEIWFPMLIGSALAAGKPVSLVNGGKRRHSFIAVEDVAEFATRAVDHPAGMRQRLLLGGPAISWSDVVAIAGQVLERPVAVQSIAPGSPIPTLPPPLDSTIGGLAAALELQDVIIDATDIARTFGVSLTSCETVLRGMLARQA